MLCKFLQTLRGKRGKRDALDIALKSRMTTYMFCWNAHDSWKFHTRFVSIVFGSESVKKETESIGESHD